MSLVLITNPMKPPSWQPHREYDGNVVKNVFRRSGLIGSKKQSIAWRIKTERQMYFKWDGKTEKLMSSRNKHFYTWHS